ncbi:MAG: hypothetical protein LT067_02105 [Sulfurovum sp.]|nr:hypothetical protein [Sulfurovum sp.]
MNVFEKIENIFKQEEQKSQCFEEILHELREIKAILDAQPKPPMQKRHDYDFYNFINEFRRSMRADIANNSYPEILYNGKRYGVNFNGFLYSKESSGIVGTAKAKEIYRYLYEHKHKAV